jgi:hypothetical protein
MFDLWYGATREVIQVVESRTGDPMCAKGDDPISSRRTHMADRKPLLGDSPARPELERLFEAARNSKVSDADLHEQRISFAYGNAPVNSRITKESVREASRTIRIINEPKI